MFFSLLLLCAPAFLYNDDETGLKRRLMPFSMEHFHYYPNQEKLMHFKPKLIFSGVLNCGPNWQSTRHRHNFCEIMYVSAGSGSIKTATGEYAIRQGDLVVYNTGEWHEESCGETKLSLLFFSLENIQIQGMEEGCLIPLEACPVIDSGSYDDVLKSFLLIMVKELREKEPYYKAISTNLAILIVYFILRLYSVPLANHEQNEMCEKAKRYIEKNYRMDITLDHLASALHISKYHFLHTFKEITDISPMKYLLFVRMREAKALLSQTNLSILEIAGAVGYENAPTFSRVFKKSENITPLEYRSHTQSGAKPD